jgi:N-acetyl-anhydromuramyl-L-alanine amidase AmpD
VNPNFYTIGIEHEGYDGNKLTAVQMQTSAELIAAIAKRWGIPLDRKHVIQHHEIRRSKTCPGSGVDIDQLISLAKQF